MFYEGDGEHPLEAQKRHDYTLSLKGGGDKWFYDNYWNDEKTIKRKQSFDERVKKRENHFYDRVIRKIKAIRHSDFPAPKAKKVDTRSAYWIAVDKAAAEILANDPEHQAWIQDQPRRRQLAKDAMKYHNNLLHTYWEIKGLGEYGVKEPPRGDASMRSRWEEYNLSLKYPKSKAQTAIDKARGKLSQVFDEAHAKRLNPEPLKPGEFMVLASGSPVEE